MISSRHKRVRNRRLAVAFLIGSFLVLDAGVSAGEHLFDSHSEAMVVIERAIEASGGIERIRHLRSVSFETAGQFTNRSQAYRPDDLEVSRYDFWEIYSIDKVEGRVCYEWSGHDPLRGLVHEKTVIDGGTRFNADLVLGTSENDAEMSIGDWRWLDWELTPLLLERLYDDLESVTWVGRTYLGTSEHDVLAFAAGRMRYLYVDRRSGLPSKLTSLRSDTKLGDTTWEIDYLDYQVIEGITVNMSRRNLIGGELWASFRHKNVHFDREFPAACSVERSPQLAEKPSTSKPVRALSVGAGATLLNLPDTSTSILVVELADRAIVVNTPEGNASAMRAYKAVKEMVGKKPIAYVVFSSHKAHVIGGARAFLGDGGSVVTRRNNRDYLQRSISATRRIRGGTELPPITDLELKWIDRRLALGNSALSLDLYNIPGTSYSENFVAAYLPADRLLYVSDLLDRDRLGVSEEMNRTAAALLQFIQSEELEVETILLGDGQTLTPAALRAEII